MNIFSTMEAEAWCRGFDYENYVSLCERTAHKLVICEESYKLFCKAFEAQMNLDMQECVDTDKGLWDIGGVEFT